ncbi:hypothetical protein SNOG_13615 [Parastagonospora nodorum SN15]|uniref:Uncharacterized protein n=1 Tax=Phaeosphaeria nodorum (strain SN15 / ATCC MYA-4574 / FGSC 10173) TaxID=321614 RepID=Q0U3P9_PHANO|nr:hypothetical protein SNOG_13615 [Parastagonospora nodorum SN15]EAT79062.1 hypothetical protein SNOG_13615 [Parastagonospora nodorum SN15]
MIRGTAACPDILHSLNAKGGAISIHHNFFYAEALDPSLNHDEGTGEGLTRVSSSWAWKA